MHLTHGLHLAYCTNIHRGEHWADIRANLERHTLAVRKRVAPDKPYAIGLRLGELAVRELQSGSNLVEFKRWLDHHNCYVFTINGFPYGKFHGTRVKEQVYAPDWTTTERLEYTQQLFQVLVKLLPEGMSGSVSTVPVSFKGFKLDDRALRKARENLWRCIEFLEHKSRETGHDLHLGLEPEPCCELETSQETVRFFEQMRADRPGDLRLQAHLGVNYDCCHLAVEYEQPDEAIARLRRAGIRISKLHLSNALRVHPTPEAREALKAFDDPVYLHQVVERTEAGDRFWYTDLGEALVTRTEDPQWKREWRIHFHIPLHAQPGGIWQTTADHVQGVLDILERQPGWCSHVEMETYTWDVLPPSLRSRSVVDQLEAEYRWTLDELARRKIHVR